MTIDHPQRAADALRISPRYSSNDWYSLDRTAAADWPRAAEIVYDRLNGRYLRFATSWLSDQFSGFVVLAIDCLLAETIQQFRAGDIHGKGKSKRYIVDFLSGPRFQPDFTENARTRFYEDIRCGLLHQAEAKEMWLVRRGRRLMLEHVSGSRGYIIDVKRFHAAISSSLDDYCRELALPDRQDLRDKLWLKMDRICQVRIARGLLYEAAS